MAAVTRRQYKGAAASTTITATLTSVATTTTLTATTGWPSTAAVPFYVVIDPGNSSEEKCSATISGSTLTLTRGQDDTTAVAHASGATIYPVFSADEADEANNMAAMMTTKGDLLVTTGSAFNRLPVGTNAYVLTADSTATNGVAWAAAAAGMSLLDSQTFNSSTTYTLSASAKIVVAEVVGGGGGGGGGSRQTITAGQGAGGNGAPSLRYTLVVGSDILSGSVTVTIGAGGTSGAGATVVANNGVAGGAGGFSTFDFFSCPGAFGGSEGLAAATNQTARLGYQTSFFIGITAGNTFGNGGYNLQNPGRKGFQGGGGGGSGGSVSTSTANVGGAGGSSETSLNSALSVSGNSYIANNSGGGAAGATSTVGTAGTSRGGGGGGGGSTTVAGGAGGVGGAGGGGAGGGGASSAAAGGAGGVGGAGQIKIWVFG